MSITRYNALTYIDECNGDYDKAIKLVHKRYRKGILTRDEWVSITETIMAERAIGEGVCAL